MLASPLARAADPVPAAPVPLPAPVAMLHPDPGPVTLPPPVQTVKMRPELMGVHPRLFLNAAAIVAMREKIKNPIVAPMWQNYLRWADVKGQETPPAVAPMSEDPFRGYGDRLSELAFAYLVSQDPKYLDYSRKWMMAVANYPNWTSDMDLAAGHCCMGLGLAYDWLYPYLSADEKKTIEDALTRHARVLLQRSLMSPGSWWGYSYFQNHCWINHTGIAVAAMATYEVNPVERQQWLDYTRTKFQPTYENLGLDGGYYEGPAYMSYGTAWSIYYIEALKSFSGEDLSHMTYLNKVTKHMFDVMMPGAFCMANFGDTDPWGWGLGDDILVWLAAQHKDGHAEWLREKNRAGVRLSTGHGPPYGSPFTLLWFDPAITAVAPDDLPTLGLYPDLGIVTFRTDWSDDAAMVAFHCGPPGGLHLVNYCAAHPLTNVNFGHEHPDANNFIFWSDRRWRIGLPGAYTHDKKTHDENVWLANDKGQRGEAQWMECKSYIGAPAQAHLVTVATSKEADYVVGEAAPAYEADAHLTSFQRHLLFVKGAKPYVVVYDRLTADQAVDWTSYLHVFEPVQILGDGKFQLDTSPLIGTGPDDRPVSPTADPATTMAGDSDTTYGTVFGPAGLTQTASPLVVLAHPTMKMTQRGYEIATASPVGTSTWQVTVITPDKSPVVLSGGDKVPKLQVGADKIEWRADGTVSLNGKVLTANQSLAMP
jgi:hypothetical protein